MPRITYNDVSFEVPDGWVDSSIISLLAPEPVALPMLRVKQNASQRPSVVMTRASATGLRFDLESYAKAQERILAEIMTGLEVLERGTLQIGEGDDDGGGRTDVAWREFSFDDPEGGVLRQAHAYLRIGDVMYTLTATGSHDASFSEVREQFVAIVNSLQSVSPAD